jgi:cell division protein ZapA
MKEMEITIMGVSYKLACPDGGEQVMLAAVSRVDKEMSAIRDSGKLRARERIAVLAALKLAYEGPNERAANTRTTAAASAVENNSTVDIESLIARIDLALGADGQLL